MSPPLLPAIVALPLATPAATGPTPASGATPNNGFAQELSQARSAKAHAAPAPAPAAPPPAPSKADKSSHKPTASAEESTSAKAVRQWLAQNAAARRTAAHGKSSSAAEAAAAATGEADATDATGAKAGRKAGALDGAEEPVAATISPATATLDLVASPVSQDTPGALGPGPDGTAPQDPKGTEIPQLTGPLPVPVGVPLVAAATIPPPASTVSIEAPSAGTVRVASDVAPRAGTEIPVADEEAPQSDDDTRRDALGDDAAATPATHAGPAVQGTTDARRSAPLAAIGAQRESGQEQSSSEHDGEGFSAVLARQVEATTPAMPQAAPLPAMPRSDGSASSPPAPTEVPVPTGFGTPEWAQSVGRQISMLAIDGVENARLHLHPAEMGPITVQITVEGQTAQVHLSVDNAETRQALEQAMPNLASSLRESGLTLTGGGVSEQPRQPEQNQDADRRPGTAQSRGRTGNLAATGEPAAAPRVARLQGVVDLYA